MSEALALPHQHTLAVSGLGKRFPGVVALDDVSVAFAPGEIHALIGQNGAGKSTLVNLLSGMLTPDAGEIRIDNVPVTVRSPRHAVESGIATVYQELSLLPNLTVAQNIALGREPRRLGLLDVRAMQEAAAAALAAIGASAIAPTDIVGILSVAERQLVEIAKALARRPSVLILDEPTAPLAKREADRLFAILHDLRGRGLTIIFVSHRFREILDHCDRGTILRNGRKIATVALAGLTEGALTEAMIGERTEAFARSCKSTVLDEALGAEGLAWRDKVRGVDLSVRFGEVVALTGLLGAGQNEIGRLLGGDLQRTAGDLRVQGQPVDTYGTANAARRGVCLLTDDRKGEGIAPNLSLGANIALPSLSHRSGPGGWVRRSRETAEVGAALDRFGVVARSPAAPIRTLSGGNQQKALLARWHLADAAVFILIEPTRGVDVGARAEIYRRIAELAAAGKAVVVISSDVPEVLALADRVLVVRGGTITAEGRPPELDEERLNLLIQGAA